MHRSYGFGAGPGALVAPPGHFSLPADGSSAARTKRGDIARGYAGGARGLRPRRNSTGLLRRAELLERVWIPSLTVFTRIPSARWEPRPLRFSPVRPDLTVSLWRRVAVPLALPPVVPQALPNQIRPYARNPKHSAACGLRFCRHLWASSWLVREVRSPHPTSASDPPRTNCAPPARRSRYRLPAGYATASHRSGASLPERYPKGGRVMGRQRGSHREPRRARGRAHSARSWQWARKEADLDRFVAALLALASGPDSKTGECSGRRHGATGESSSTERTCRR